MSGPQVYFSWPTTFKLIPDSLPQVLPPPIKEWSFRSPFAIDKDLFNFALRPEIPIAFAACYILTVFSLNAYNKSRDHKPWWIARQKPFLWFIVVHNVFLALYSFATLAAMWRAIVHTWPGYDSSNGLAGIADALCKLHGPRGMGDAATFNSTINIWEVKSTAIHLGYDGNPDPTDFGRLWNEGLAFWGWLFYVSKFYEVLDTIIILAKGKRSATLQTYHHAGAMLCMWAGIRYMSPPIWMFVFINSGIHGMMYTYFTLSAIGVKVPQSIKRTLTSLQIAQFVFGASYAALHLFIQYDIPISTPYQIASTIQKAVSSASSAVSSVSSEVSKVIASPTATAALGPLLKKLLLRAAGEEGVAERIRDRRGELTSPHMEEKIEHFNEQTFETKWRTDWTKVNCIDTTGEAFAIYLNLLYLAPLTWLFLRFFIRAYTQRGKPRSASQAESDTRYSARQAEKDTRLAIEQSGEKMEDEMGRRGSEAAGKIRQGTNDLHDQLREDVKRMKEGKFRGDRRVSDRVASFEKQVKSTAEKVKEKGKEMVNGSGNASPRRGGSPSKKENQRPPVKEEDESAIEDEPSDEQKSQPQKDDDPFQDKPKDEPKDESKPESVDEPKDEPKDEYEAESKDAPKEGEKESEPPLGSGTNNESEEKQEENMADSQATREGGAEAANEDATSQPPQTSGATEDANAPQDEDPADDEDKENEAPGLLGSGARNQPEEKQDENIADSQALRPGADGEDADDDPDAMGKSGSIIDLSKEKATDATEGTEGDEDPTEGAESAGTQWKPPGENGS